jgi:deoxycytidylate deaminase
MPVKIHNKEYFTVAERMAMFRDEFPEYTLETNLIYQDDDKVIMKAFILNGTNLVSTGYAEEVRGATSINKTSALENAETSAIGRALAFFKFAGTEIASADELAGALAQQSASELVEYNELVRNYWASINRAKEFLEPIWGEREDQVNVTEARECLAEIPEEDRKRIWKAPTKGGIFTTNERKLLKEKPEDSL